MWQWPSGHGATPMASRTTPIARRRQAPRTATAWRGRPPRARRRSSAHRRQLRHPRPTPPRSALQPRRATPSWKPDERGPRSRRQPSARPKRTSRPRCAARTATEPTVTNARCKAASASCGPTRRASARSSTTTVAPKRCSAPESRSTATAVEKALARAGAAALLASVFQPRPRRPGLCRAVDALGQFLALRPIAHAPGLFRVDIEPPHDLDAIALAQHVPWSLLAPPDTHRPPARSQRIFAEASHLIEQAARTQGIAHGAAGGQTQAHQAHLARSQPKGHLDVDVSGGHAPARPV